MRDNSKFIRNIIIAAVAVVVVVLLLASSCTIVDSNERAVLTQFGKIKGDVIEPGLNLHIPFVEKVRKDRKSVV